MKIRIAGPGAAAWCAATVVALLARLTLAQEQDQPAVAAPPVRLEHKLTAGTELIYDNTSELNQDMSGPSGEKVHYAMTLNGRTEQTVAGVAWWNGVALIGWLGTGRWQITAGTAGAKEAANEQVWLSAYRMDRTGRSIRRVSKQDNVRQYLLRREADQISEGAQVCAAFPREKVRVGSRWEGDVLLPLPGTRQPGRAISTLVGISNENGTAYGIIRSALSSEKEQAHATWRGGLRRPDMNVKGTSEGKFDIGRGVWVQMQVDLLTRFEGRGFDGAMEVKSLTKLASLRALPRHAAAERCGKIRAFDRALGKLYEDELEPAVALLEAQQREEREPDRQKGLAVTLALLRPILNHTSTVARTQSGDEARPDAGVAPAQNEKHDDALVLYKRAGAYAEAGDLAQAVAAYEQFLSSTNSRIPAANRLLGQYRLAGLLEKLGRKEPAMAAYRAVAEAQAGDAYCRALQAKARERVAQLSVNPLK